MGYSIFYKMYQKFSNFSQDYYFFYTFLKQFMYVDLLNIFSKIYGKFWFGIKNFVKYVVLKIHLNFTQYLPENTYIFRKFLKFFEDFF